MFVRKLSWYITIGKIFKSYFRSTESMWLTHSLENLPENSAVILIVLNVSRLFFVYHGCEKPSQFLKVIFIKYTMLDRLHPATHSKLNIYCHHNQAYCPTLPRTAIKYILIQKLNLRINLFTLYFNTINQFTSRDI